MGSDNTKDVLALLREQHDEARTLLRTVASASAGERDRSFQTLAEKLAQHELAEEAVVYPAIRQVSGGEEIAKERMAEESAAEKTLTSLKGMDSSSSPFETMFRQFKTDVERHAEHEEATVFPILEQMDMGTRATLGERFAETQAKLTSQV